MDQKYSQTNIPVPHCIYFLCITHNSFRIIAFHYVIFIVPNIHKLHFFETKVVCFVLLSLVLFGRTFSKGKGKVQFLVAVSKVSMLQKNLVVAVALAFKTWGTQLSQAPPSIEALEEPRPWRDTVELICSKYREPRPWRDTVQSICSKYQEPCPWRDTVQSICSKYRGPRPWRDTVQSICSKYREPHPWRDAVKSVYPKYRGSRRTSSLESYSRVGKSLWSVSQVKSVSSVYKQVW